MEQQKQRDITLFYSYAPTDSKWRNQLASHLSQLKREGLIQEKFDQQIPAGEDREKMIDQAICSADIILLLISADFLASDALYDAEMRQALERHRRGEARVIPIIVRPCDWQSSPCANLQCLPRTAKPITTWKNRDEAFTSIVQDLRKIITQQHSSSPPLSHLQRQNRVRLLKRVRAWWVEGWLKDSLHKAAWIDVHLQAQPDASEENPWRLQVQELHHEPHPLPIDTTIIDVYDEADGELLILGEPGSGKTTQLLHLAHVLLDRAEADERLPMPVVFHLSSWAQKQAPFAAWLAEELRTKYKVPLPVGQRWVEDHQILPLLDGLDEVKAEARVACVQAITDYYDQQDLNPTPLVLCCRSEEYEALPLHIPLQRAVSILPLADDQIEHYLSSAQEQLEGLWQALRDDAELLVLAHRPLMLSIFTLAYQDMNVDESSTKSTPEQRVQQIFDRYVKRMLSRRQSLPIWMQKDFLYWLSALAKYIQQQQQSALIVEELQPDMLPNKYQRIYRWCLILSVVLGYALIILLVCGIAGALTFGLGVGLLYGLLGVGFYGLLSGLLLFLDNRKIQPVEAISWSWIDAALALVGHRIIVALGVGVGTALIYGENVGILFGISYWLIVALSAGASRKQLTERIHLSPNEGIWRSARNGLIVGVLFGPLSGLISGLLFGSRSNSLLFGLVSGLSVGLIGGLVFGLRSFAQHFLLRFFLWRLNYLPWSLIPFLDEATERLLLRKVGGSYLFTHRLLLEYFASLDKTVHPQKPFQHR